jgi:hypothetical protein
MSSDSTEVIVASDITVWRAPVGTTAPVDLTAPGVGWSDLGFVGEDSVNFATNPTFTEIFAHQQASAIRLIKSRDAASLAAALKQWNTETWEAAFGGGAVTVTAGVAKFTPPIDTATTPQAIMVDGFDGTFTYRLIIPKCRVRSGVTLPFKRTDSSDLAVTFETEAAAAGVAAWYVLTDNVDAFTAG